MVQRRSSPPSSTFTLRVRNHDGTYPELSGFARTRREAEEAPARRLADRRSADSDDSITPSTPLVAIGRQWVKRIARTDSGLTARSVADYSATFGRYIDADGSSLRGLTLREADDPARLTGFLRSVADNHGNGAAKQCRVVLGHIFRMAGRNRALVGSPMRDVEKVRAQTTKATVRDTERAFLRAERDQVVTHAYALAEAPDANPRTEPKRWATADLIALLARTGLRINEARALRWADLELDQGRATIRGTKTQSAHRRVNLATWLCERLRARAERVGTDGLFFASPTHVDQPEKLWEQGQQR